jgi:hypothetical protein
MWRYRTARRVRQKLGRVWRDHACAAPLRHLVGRGLSLGDMGFELCYLPDMPAVLRVLASAENSIERWWQQLEAAKKPRRAPPR